MNTNSADMKTIIIFTTKVLERFTLDIPPILFLFSSLVDPMDDLKLLLSVLSVGSKNSGL